ncbi:hypothetical protein CKAH01_15580 [Colletotrichum kahawae]|uniref:Uncharacterized protein n=1 Tax=Colletotrichum kahawae TaxID=34407 RepID=A0AAE0D6M9_COLKA|nr:hypothetical protein CKAH01_15580 [Colletotrichum kahawae]
MLHCIVNHGHYPTTGRPKLPIDWPGEISPLQTIIWVLRHHDPSWLHRRQPHSSGTCTWGPLSTAPSSPPVSSLRGCWTLACRLSPAGPRTKCSLFAQNHGYHWLSTWHQTHQTLAAAAC